MHKLTWNCLPFGELKPDQLYEILRLRAEVFVLEQQCLYQDLDNYDQHALHLVGNNGPALLCYARLLPPSMKYTEPSIGRVICALNERGKGYGKELVQESLNYCNLYWPDSGVRISAQLRLAKLYQEFDFKLATDPYLEDGIPHVEMFRD